MQAADTVIDIMPLVRGDSLPDEPAHIDLRFLRRIYLADTYNGVGSCVDGVEYYAILYGNKVVHQSAIYRDRNNVRHRQSFDDNNELYYHMFEVAQRYMKIVEIARMKYFGEAPKESSDKFWDCLILDEKTFSTLVAHPQYKKVLKDFGLELKKVDEFDLYRVECSKRNQC